MGPSGPTLLPTHRQGFMCFLIWAASLYFLSFSCSLTLSPAHLNSVLPSTPGVLILGSLPAQPPPSHSLSKDQDGRSLPSIPFASVSSRTGSLSRAGQAFPRLLTKNKTFICCVCKWQACGGQRLRRECPLFPPEPQRSSSDCQTRWQASRRS